MLQCTMQFGSLFGDPEKVNWRRSQVNWEMDDQVALVASEFWLPEWERENS